MAEPLLFGAAFHAGDRLPAWVVRNLLSEELQRVVGILAQDLKDLFWHLASSQKKSIRIVVEVCRYTLDHLSRRRDRISFELCLDTSSRRLAQGASLLDADTRLFSQLPENVP